MLLLLAILLQVPVVAPQANPEPSAASLERIRRGLQDDDGRFTAPVPVRPVFRMMIRETRMPLSVLWEDQTHRPAYVLPRQPAAHYEFLRQVTPEEFRTSTLHPIGVSVLPLIEWAWRGIAREVRSSTEKRIRKRIQEELRELERARAALKPPR